VKGWSLTRRLGTAFALASILLACGAVFVAVTAHRLSVAENRVTGRIYDVTRSSNDLLSAYLDQETGVRGYALSGDLQYLAPYNSGRSDQLAAQRSLTIALRSEPALAAYLKRFEDAATTWQTDFALPSINAVKTGGQGSVTNAEQARGKTLFDNVRSAYTTYLDNVRNVRARAVTQMNDDRTTLIVALIAAGVLLLLSALAVALALRVWVVRPLLNLRREVGLVAAGDLAHAVDARGPPEIQALGADVDVMRQRIVEQYHEALEAQTATESARRQLEMQGSELARSNAELEQFAYVASHDLQEPLRKVASFTEMLQRRYEGQLDERADQYIGFAVDGAKRMQRLINDLLAFSRVGRSTPTFSYVELEEAYRQAVRNLDLAIQEAGGEVSHDPLPAVVGEAGLLTQVFQNLIGNGIKFSRPGVPPRVHVSSHRVGDEYEISVQDNGIGISEEYQDRVFVLFQRLHRKEEYDGTGIGLSLTKKIVEYHGGQITLSSDIVGGTTVRFTLPVPGSVNALVQPADDAQEPV
jgi:signal transduction histidine kinase